MIDAQKNPRGGSRPGAGAKPKGSVARVTLVARVDCVARDRILAAARAEGGSLGDYLSAHGLSLPGGSVIFPQ